MSKNHKKKKSHNKNRKPNQRKKQQTLKWHEKLSQKVSFTPIKTFFVELISKNKKNIKRLDVMTLIKESRHSVIRYIKHNKQGVLFGTSLTLVVIVGYFAIVYQSDADKAKRIEAFQETTEVVSIDLSESNTTYMDNVESEVGQIQKSADVSVETEVTEVVHDDVVEVTGDDSVVEEDNDGEVVVELPVAEPVEKITSSIITNPVVTSRLTITDEPKYDTVESSMIVGIDMYAILVDGKEVAYFETEGEAHVVLNDLKRSFMAEDAIEERVIYQETIEVAKVKRNILDFSGYKSKDEIMEYIVKGTNEQRIHTVVSGDNFWDIAEKYELNVNNLLDSNPDINEKRLQIGTELSLIVAEPIINVVTISMIERVDLLPYGRDEDIPTANYFEKEYKVKVAGVPGEAENLIEVYMVNGKIIGEKVVSSNVTKEPKNLVMWAGTKKAPPKKGVGYFINPTSRGYITSGFGNRSLGYHNGIDIGVPMHTDVKAADGGVVLFAGYKGTYGKLVMIDHGANKISYYAHNDVLKVSAGQNVYQGQLIALSGNTGRSTGPHLHFEVRVNGSPVNPRGMVNY